MQERTEDVKGRGWKVTGAGKRNGTLHGHFAAEIVIYKDVIPRVLNGEIAFNLDQEAYTINRMKGDYPFTDARLYPRTAGQYWVEPLYDCHRTKSAKDTERKQKKNAVASGKTVKPKKKPAAVTHDTSKKRSGIETRPNKQPQKKKKQATLK